MTHECHLQQGRGWDRPLNDRNKEGLPRGDGILSLDEGSGYMCAQIWYNSPDCTVTKRHILVYVIRACTYACVCGTCRNCIATFPFGAQDAFLNIHFIVYRLIFMCMGALPACTCVHHVQAWCPCRGEGSHRIPWNWSYG